jgi:integrase
MRSRQSFLLSARLCDGSLCLGPECGLVKLPSSHWPTLTGQTGTVTLRSTKSRRVDILPLPISTGQAIADYLRYERPRTINPAVFVRRLAPHDAPISADAVHRLIRDAYRRIGLDHGRTHALRHTLARRLLDQGDSLKEVADILRHRSLDNR